MEHSGDEAATAQVPRVVETLSWGHQPPGRGDFEDFYASEMPRLVALARGLCGAAHADDVAQEAMLVAYRRWSHVRELERPDAWVRRTCANLAVSTFRRRLVELRAVTRLQQRPAAVPVDDDVEAFWSHVRSLPRRQAQVVALHYLVDLTVEDVAATLEVSSGTVKVHLSRARASLARRLGLELEEDA